MSDPDIIYQHSYHVWFFLGKMVGSKNQAECQDLPTLLNNNFKKLTLIICGLEDQLLGMNGKAAICQS